MICGRCNCPIEFTVEDVQQGGVKLVVNLTEPPKQKLDHNTHWDEAECRKALRKKKGEE
jgi:hypothetical protein